MYVSQSNSMITMDIHEMKTIKVMKIVKRTNENMQNAHQSRLSDANTLTQTPTHHEGMNEQTESKLTFQTEHLTFESVLIRSQFAKRKHSIRI